SRVHVAAAVDVLRLLDFRFLLLLAGLGTRCAAGDETRELRNLAKRRPVPGAGTQDGAVAVDQALREPGPNRSQVQGSDLAPVPDPHPAARPPQLPAPVAPSLCGLPPVPAGPARQ